MKNIIVNSNRSRPDTDTAGKSIRRAGLAFALILSSSAAGAQEASAVWTRLYGRAQTIEHRIEIMTNIVELDDRGFIPLMISALGELVESNRNAMSATDREAVNRLIGLIVNELGDLRASEAADLLYTVYKESGDPILRGEAITALGRAGAGEYADEIALVLRNLNFNSAPSEKNREGEIIAYACVYALERMKDQIGFEPVFFASIGWYSPASRVREEAAKALLTIVDDPSEQLKRIMTSEPLFTVKYAALEAEARSSASAAGREMVAVEGLRQGLSYQTRDIRELNTLSALRTLAAATIRNGGLTDLSAVPYLEKMLYADYDINERLTAIEALGTSGDEAAVMALSRFLRYQNERQTAGLVASDNRIVIATIRALAATGNTLAVEELMMVRHSNWSGTVNREAAAALERLQNK